jgi:hypothetical protein
MVRFLRVVGRIVLGVILFGVAVACLVFVVHRMQLHRLNALAKAPMQRYVVEDSPFFVLNGVSVIDGALLQIL